MENITLDAHTDEQINAVNKRVFRRDLARFCTLFGAFVWCFCLFLAGQYAEMSSLTTWAEVYSSSQIPTLAEIAKFYIILCPFALAGILPCVFAAHINPLKDTENPVRRLLPHQITLALCAASGTAAMQLHFARLSVNSIIRGLEAYGESAEAYVLPQWVQPVTLCFVLAAAVCIALTVIFTLVYMKKENVKAKDCFVLHLFFGKLQAEKPTQPSYRIGKYRKGTWLQIIGWVWLVVSSFVSFIFSQLCYPEPKITALTGDGIDTFTGPVHADAIACRSFLLTFLTVLGWFFIYYGFTLNRKPHATYRLFFRQFSLCQLLLILSHACFSLSYLFAVAHIADHLGRYSDHPLMFGCIFLIPASFILFFTAAGIRLFRHLRTVKERKKQTE